MQSLIRRRHNSLRDYRRKKFNTHIENAKVSGLRVWFCHVTLVEAFWYITKVVQQTRIMHNIVIMRSAINRLTGIRRDRDITKVTKISIFLANEKPMNRSIWDVMLKADVTHILDPTGHKCRNFSHITHREDAMVYLVVQERSFLCCTDEIKALTNGYSFAQQMLNGNVH